MERRIPFLSLKARNAPIEEDLYRCVRRVIDSGAYLNGSETEAFASELSAKLGLGNVVAVSNGLDAIRLIIRGYMELGRLHPGDGVIVPANTYIASVLPVSEFGLHPLLVVPDLSTFGLDWRQAEEAAISHGIKALITVHLYGTPSWDFEIARRLRERGLLIIEDNAQAIGAAITDPSTGETFCTGSLGDAAAFSFYPTKNIGALGDAGAVATPDTELAKTVRALANYGSTRRYHNDFIGYNCRMDEIQAAILRLKLGSLDEEIRRRREIAEIYDSLIVASEVSLPIFHPDMRQVWHQYVIRYPHRDWLKDFLEANGVETDIHYPLALFDQRCYHSHPLRGYGDAAAITRRLAGEILSLPVGSVSPEEAERVASIINNANLTI